MDINNTYFHMLTGENDWETLLESQGVNDLWWDQQKASLSLLPQVFQFSRTSDNELTLKPSARRGAAQDSYANSYWISDNQQGIQIMPAGTESSGIYWTLDRLTAVADRCDAERDFKALESSLDTSQIRLQGLTVSTHHYLVVGTLNPGGILIFDLHGGGPPEWLRWPAQLQFTPFDMSALEDGGIVILDSDLQTDTARYWKMDRYFRVLDPVKNTTVLTPGTEADFLPLTSSDTDESNETVSGQSLALPAEMLLATHQAIAIETLGEDGVLILASSANNSHSVLHYIYQGVETAVIALRDEMISKVFVETDIKAHDFAVLPGPIEFAGQIKAELSLVLSNGNQAVRFSVTVSAKDIDLVIVPHYLPLRQFSGKALMAGKTSLFYDIEDRWYTLTAQPRQRYLSEARVEGLVLDGKQNNCVWHRIIIDGCIPDATEIEIETRSAEEQRLLQYSEWQKEVNPYLRGDGSEIPLHQAYSNNELHDNEVGTWEWLIQNACGRFIELRLRLVGNGRSTPRIRALRVYYPRFSYLKKFLPAVYREDEIQASFLDRYLANAEGFLSKIESQIASAEAYFDTRTMPEEYLQWLASWLGAALNNEWSEQRKRLFIDHAELMFRWHGTRIGLQAAIKLVIDECPDAGIFQQLKEGRESIARGGAGGEVRIVERFMFRTQQGVQTAEGSLLESQNGSQDGLAQSQLSSTFEELGDSNTLNQRYAEFLYQRYMQLADIEADALELLNQAWQKEPELNSFEEITFTSEPPEKTSELQDWRQFVRHELALLQRWQPAYGSYALHVRFQEYCRKKYSQAYTEQNALQVLNQNWQKTYRRFEDIVFSPVTPVQAKAAEDWIEFTERDLGFQYAQVGEKDTPLYQAFLARRYKTTDRLSRVYSPGRVDTDLTFADIRLPAEDKMPDSPIVLRDWIQFVSLTLPVKRNAHRFTVLVPTEPGELPQSREHRLAQVADIVRREKPAHTDFDVKLYWALFQVGSARLGLDTNLGEGARYVAIVLGENYLGQGVLDYSHPWNIADRHITGRDQLQRSLHGE